MVCNSPSVSVSVKNAATVAEERLEVLRLRMERMETQSLVGKVHRRRNRHKRASGAAGEVDPAVAAPVWAVRAAVIGDYRPSTPSGWKRAC